jgi:hypothetical protein
LIFPLGFHAQGQSPTEEGDYVLYNQCDGFHCAEARLDPDGSFAGFFTFMGTPYQDDEYQAWARLPDTDALYERFSDKPTTTMSAHQVMRERLRRQERA